MNTERIGSKIMVVGCCGSGKSTLSRKLADRTGLPLYHLDMIWWRPDKTHIPRAEFDQRLEAILSGARWIVEGDYSRTYEPRLRACDTVIFLDYDEETCMTGLRQRVGQKRSDIPWVEQKLEQELVDFVYSFRRDNRPKLLALLEQYPEKQRFLFHSRAEADAWLEALPPGGDGPETFATADRSAWRSWLAEHFETAAEIWFVFPTKAAGEESLSYNDAVEEALCFGWIDSTNRRLDETHCIRRFSPRKKGSPYSQPNIERLLWLDARGLLQPELRKSVLPLLETPFVFPPDILAALRADEAAWENYQRFSEPYRRIRVAYIEAARKRPEEFQKRLNSFLEKTRRNQIIRGYGGVEKYYREGSAALQEDPDFQTATS